MKILIDVSNLVHKAFAALLYQEINKIDDKTLSKDEKKELAIKNISSDFVLHNIFSMLETTKSVLNGEWKDIVLVYDKGSWRKSWLKNFNSQKIHTINGKDYILNNIEINYKEGRDKFGKNLIHESIEKTEKIFQELGIKTIFKEGMEADDVISFLTEIYKEEDLVYISSNDKDFYQTMKIGNVSLYNSSSKEKTKLSIKEAKNYFMKKVLIKDASDNIENVIPTFYSKKTEENYPEPRWGEKTAEAMVKKHQNIKEILNELANNIYTKHLDYIKKINNKNITKEQKETKKWFRNSLVVKNGKPLKTFHGTKSNFEEFSMDYVAVGNQQYGSGFYFTDSKETSETYAETDGFVHEVYLKIEKPIQDNTTLTYEEIEKLISKAPKYKNTLSNWGDIKYEGIDKVLKNAVDTYINLNGLDLINSISNDFYNENEEKFLKNLHRITKFDGYIKKLDGENFYICFLPEQIRFSDKCDFYEEIKNEYSLEDIKNILEIYYKRNKKLMDFNEIPSDIKKDFFENVNKELLFKNNVVENFPEILSKYNLNKFSEIYKKQEIDIYQN